MNTVMREYANNSYLPYNKIIVSESSNSLW